jgi:RNA polymerase sigma factor (sigma-70 family)
VDPLTPGTGAAPPLDASAPDSGERPLVAAILRQDRKAAAQFVAAHIDAVFAYVRHRLSPRADLVDDVVQDVFLAALGGLAGFHHQSSLRSWILGIARHKVEDTYRRLLRAPDALDTDDAGPHEPAAPSPPIEDQLDSARARARARLVLRRIPERYALVLLWRYWQQRSVREIAGAIGATEKSVERTLARARARFRELWLREGSDE